MRLPQPILVQVVHIAGPLKGEIRDYSAQNITIGRNPSCLLAFPPDTATVSRNHADIVQVGNSWKIIDHSTNGTYVNGVKIQESALKDGDVVEFSHGGPKISVLFKPGNPEKKTAVSEVQPAPRAAADDTPPRPAAGPAVTVDVPLVVQLGPSIRTFRRLPIILGSGASCDFPALVPGLADRHLEISGRDGAFRVRDLTGKGVVRLNGRPLDGAERLSELDQLSLGPDGPVLMLAADGRLIEIEKDAERVPDVPPDPAPLSRDTAPGGFWSRLRGSS